MLWFQKFQGVLKEKQQLLRGQIKMKNSFLAEEIDFGEF